jgi:outer membrane usher protein
MFLAAQALIAAAETPGALPLQLEVALNGHPTGRIVGFELLPDGRISAKRSDLTNLGVDLPDEGAPQDDIVLSNIPRLKYRYDDQQQTIELRIIRDASNPNSFDLRGQGEVLKPESGTGMFVNYSLYGSANGRFEDARFTGASALLDAHGFTPYGSLKQSQVLGTTPESEQSYKRLDTSYSFSSVDHMASFNAGDLTSGSFWWTQPIRLGGLQLKRDFATRPDLVTMPLPSFSGSAVVPSTVDVFINNVKAYSGDVPEGAFDLDNIPVYSGSGVARIVLHDAQGREIVTEQPFYASPKLLRPGLLDYSIEAGWARRSHGSRSFDYDDKLLGSGGLRYGMSEWVTAEGHGEGFVGLLSGGAGAVINAGSFGLISLAAEGSSYDGATGAQLNAGWELSKGNFHISASSKRSFGDFADIGAATESSASSNSRPIAAEQISLGFGWPEWESSFGASIIHSEFADGAESNILTASFRQQLPLEISFHAGGFVDLADRDSLGIQAGVHIPLGGRYSSSTGVRWDKDDAQATGSISKSMENKPGGYGWRLDYGEGDTRSIAASGSYYTSRNLIAGSVRHQSGMTSTNASVDGAVAFADGDIFLSRRIADGFSVVDVGAPEVPVFSHNRLAGKTGRNGKLLVTGLAPYQKHTVRIETDELPLDAEVPDTEAETVVARNSGSVVRLRVKRSSHSALVVFRLLNGSLAPAGSIVRLNGGTEEFLVGYDGQAYLSGLAERNNVTLELAEGQCAGSFGYAPETRRQTIIEVPCR